MSGQQVMAERVVRLDLCIEAGPEADAEELAELAAGLREWLLELDIESAEPATAGPAPLDTRAGEVLVPGALTVMLALPLLEQLIDAVQLWVSLRNGRSVTLEIGDEKIVVNGITRGDQRKLIQLWIDRHADR